MGELRGVSDGREGRQSERPLISLAEQGVGARVPCLIAGGLPWVGEGDELSLGWDGCTASYERFCIRLQG